MPRNPPKPHGARVAGGGAGGRGARGRPVVAPSWQRRRHCRGRGLGAVRSQRDDHAQRAAGAARRGEAEMTRLVLAGLAVLAIIYTVPILVYAAFASFWGMAVPPGSVTIFLTGILLSKAGTAGAPGRSSH